MTAEQIAHPQAPKALPLDRFHQSGARELQFPDVAFIRGRSRVLFLSRIGHGVVCHGTDSGVRLSSAKA